MCKRLAVFMLVGIVGIAPVAVADIIDITLLSNPPYTSAELAVYLPMVSTSAEPPVGFNGANIGNGTGNGQNEAVGFSFVFQPLAAIESAYLTIDLTPLGTGSDELLFADNFSVRGNGYAGAKFYGNTRLEVLASGKRTIVTFDLMAMDYTDRYGKFMGVEDLSMYLLDGDLSVVYADDALIHSARLRINTGFISLPPLPVIPPPPPPPPPCNVPEASTMIMMIIGLFGVGVRGRGKRLNCDVGD